MAKEKKITKYIAKLDTILPFLRLIAYGCYHRSHFIAMGISPSVYDDCLRKLRFAVGDTFLTKKRHSGGDVFHFVGDTYHSSDNDLFPLMKMKSFTRTEVFLLRVLILHILQTSDEGLSLIDTIKILEEFGNFERHIHDYIMSIDNVRGQMKYLTNAGIINNSKKGNSILYTRQSNPLAALSDDEKRCIARALAFAQNATMLSSKPYFLKEKILRSINEREEESPIFVFKNIYPAGIFDEPLIEMLIEAGRKKQSIAYRYNKKWHIGWPWGLAVDFAYSRRYVTIIEKKKKMQHCRLDKIMNIKQDRTLRDRPHAVSTEQKQETVQFILHAEGQDLQILQKQIGERYKQCNFYEQAGAQYCRIITDDINAIAPWAREMMPLVEVIDDDRHFLRKHITEDLKKGLEQYGCI